MKTEDFFTFMGEVNDEATQIMRAASVEYAADEDKFFNFRLVADILGQHPRLEDIPQDELTHIVASVYFLKHVFSIVRNVSTREDMRGRYIDARNYLDLMHGIWDESFSPDVRAAQDMQEQLSIDLGTLPGVKVS